MKTRAFVHFDDLAERLTCAVSNYIRNQVKVDLDPEKLRDAAVQILRACAEHAAQGEIRRQMQSQGPAAGIALADFLDCTTAAIRNSHDCPVTPDIVVAVGIQVAEQPSPGPRPIAGLLPAPAGSPVYAHQPAVSAPGSGPGDFGPS